MNSSEYVYINNHSEEKQDLGMMKHLGHGHLK